MKEGRSRGCISNSTKVSTVGKETKKVRKGKKLHQIGNLGRAWGRLGTEGALVWYEPVQDRGKSSEEYQSETSIMGGQAQSSWGDRLRAWSRWRGEEPRESTSERGWDGKGVLPLNRRCEVGTSISQECVMIRRGRQRRLQPKKGKVGDRRSLAKERGRWGGGGQ